jgi:hypothetical protein
VKKSIVTWGQLRNPVLSYGDASITDVAVHRVKGRWSLLFSDFQDNPTSSTIGRAMSDDLYFWDPRVLDGPGWPFSLPQADGSLPAVAPDVIRSDGEWIVTYQAPVGGQMRLFYRSSKDLVHFDDAKPLASELYPLPADSMTDPALADTGRGLILAFQHNGVFEVALGGSLDGPWRLLGTPDTGPAQDYQFIYIDGHWNLIATTIPDGQISMFVLSGDSQDPAAWTYWTKTATFVVPQEGWNSGIRSTAAFLYDARRYDGYWYLFYTGAGPPDLLGHPGRTMIGVARSTDLMTWQVPPTSATETPPTQ